MADKEFKARLVQKHDIEVNWIKAAEFIPKKGEIIVYDIESTDGETLLEGVSLPSDEEHKRTTPYIYERFKIGDGIKYVTDLPFANGIDIEGLEFGNATIVPEVSSTGSVGSSEHVFSEGYFDKINAATADLSNELQFINTEDSTTNLSLDSSGLTKKGKSYSVSQMTEATYNTFKFISEANSYPNIGTVYSSFIFQAQQNFLTWAYNTGYLHITCPSYGSPYTNPNIGGIFLSSTIDDDPSHAGNINYCAPLTLLGSNVTIHGTYKPSDGIGGNENTILIDAGYNGSSGWSGITLQTNAIYPGCQGTHQLVWSCDDYGPLLYPIKDANNSIAYAKLGSSSHPWHFACLDSQLLFVGTDSSTMLTLDSSGLTKYSSKTLESETGYNTFTITVNSNNRATSVPGMYSYGSILLKPNFISTSTNNNYSYLHILKPYEYGFSSGGIALISATDEDPSHTTSSYYAPLTLCGSSVSLTTNGNSLTWSSSSGLFSLVSTATNSYLGSSGVPWNCLYVNKISSKGVLDSTIDFQLTGVSAMTLAYMDGSINTYTLRPASSGACNLGTSAIPWPTTYTNNIIRAFSEATQSTDNKLTLKASMPAPPSGSTYYSSWGTGIDFIVNSSFVTNSTNPPLSTHKLTWGYANYNAAYNVGCLYPTTDSWLGSEAYTWSRIYTTSICSKGSSGSYISFGNGTYYTMMIVGQTSTTDSTYVLRPSSNSTSDTTGMNLGNSSYQWRNIYTRAIYVNGTSQHSDRSAKCNIKYLSDADNAPMSRTRSVDVEDTSNLVTTSDIIDFVEQLNPATFIYKNGEDEVSEDEAESIMIQLGLIADDIYDHKLFKYIGTSEYRDDIIEEEERDEEGNVVKEAVTESRLHRGLKTLPLTVTALTACKYLLNKITELENQISELQNK